MQCVGADYEIYDRTSRCGDGNTIIFVIIMLKNIQEF